MLTWMKRLVAGGAMALAIGATGVMVTSPAHADEVKKPAVDDASWLGFVLRRFNPQQEHLVYLYAMFHGLLFDYSAMGHLWL